MAINPIVFPGDFDLGTNRNEEQIKKIQKQLAYLGFFAQYTDVPGFYGRYTYNAIRAFQSAKGLPITGKLDDVTWNKVFESTTVPIKKVLEDTVDFRTQPEYLSRVLNYKHVGGDFYGSERLNQSNYGYDGGDFYGVERVGQSNYKYIGGDFYGSERLGQSNYVFTTPTKWFDKSDTNAVNISGKFKGFSYKNINTAKGDTTEFRSYIINAATDTWIPLPIVPESLSKAVSAQWNDTTVIGRSAAYRSYTGTSNRTVNFTLKFHMDFLEQLSNEDIDLTMIVNYLESLCYPEYTKSALKPPVCIIKIADLIKMRGTVDSVNINYQLPIKKLVKGNYKNKLMYSQCDVGIQFTEVPIKAPKASGIATGTDYSG